MTRCTRPVSWIKAALKAFTATFPAAAQSICLTARNDRGRGWQGRPGQAHAGPGGGVFEIALPFRGAAFRVEYAVQVGEAIWVVHAFQKKSTQGIRTSQRDIEVIKDRLRRLKESVQ